jgi:hypothetical protein
MDFWCECMDFVGDQGETADLSPAEAAEFERIDDLVYMGQAGPVSAADASFGLRGEAEIRAQLVHSPFLCRRATG